MIGGIVTTDTVVGLITAKVLESVSAADDVRPQRQILGMDRRRRVAFAERRRGVGDGGPGGTLLPRTVAASS